MSVIAGIEAASAASNQRIAETIPQQKEPQPFHFSNPNWLREGRYVQVEWIATKAVETLVEMSCMSADGETFTFTRPQYLTEEVILSKTGTITKSLPSAEEVKRQDPARVTETLNFSPDKELRELGDGTVQEFQPPTMVILEKHYGNFIVSAARRNG